MATSDQIMKRTKLRMTVFITLFFMCVVAFVLGIKIGTIDISVNQVIRGIFYKEASVTGMTIHNIRLPRMILATIVGANLAVSGAILQGIMRNPLADPSIIGISSGAGLFGIYVLTALPQFIFLAPIAAFFGAMLAAMLIYVLAWKNGIQPIRIILAGVAVSALFSAGISATLVFFSDRVHGALTFMSGSLATKSWGEVYNTLPYTVIGIALALIFAQKMNILILGDDVARGLGLDVEKTRFICTAIAALLAASAVSSVGLLGFVGLIVPHSIRMILGNNYKILIPASALLGAALVMFSDTVARTVLSPVEIPVGIIMALLGAPFFLYLLRR